MRFMYTRPDGGVSIGSAVPKEDVERHVGPLTEENYMAFVLGKSLPKGVKQVLILADDWAAPESRHFRNAWKISDEGHVEVDMERARDIQRDHIRAERAPQFTKLDVEMVQAMGRDDKAALADVEARKQALRDAPAHDALKAAATPDELAAIKLADLV